MKKKALSLTLVLVMLLSLTPLSVFAEGETSGTYTDDKGISYTLSDGTLTVSGEGECGGDWELYFDPTAVTTLVIESGITDIGEKAFYQCGSIESVTIPEGVKTIGKEAFYNCYSIKDLVLPDGMLIVARAAFMECRSIQTVTIPNTMLSIGEYGLSCMSLTDVYYSGTEEQWEGSPMKGDNNWFLLNATTHFGNEPVPESAFSDIPYDPYYKYYAIPVIWAADKGIVGGYPDGAFCPMNVCTRAQIVTFIWRANGCPKPDGTAQGFNDIEEGAYYYEAILWAAEQGITGGFNDGGFHPNETVTRAQAMTFLWRAENKPAVPTNTVNNFADVANTAYYHDAVLWAVANGVTGGYNMFQFGSMDGCTRAQIVTFLYRDIME